MDVDPAFVPISLVTKSSPSGALPITIVRTPAPSVQTVASKASSMSIDSRSGHGHQRFSSALQLLKRFPIPHFHSTSSSTLADSPAYSAGSSTTTSSASSAVSIPPCKPVHVASHARRPAQMVY